MKRRFALTLAAVLILTLAVCGGGIENIPGGREGAWEESVTLQTEMLAAAGRLLCLLFAKPLAAIDRALERLEMGYIERRLTFTILGPV
ncbi:MAG: hypothetical protein HDT19_06300 [Oscillibacter sp.]|nr:hypothetical protein [Oscillibacter sp.]